MKYTIAAQTDIGSTRPANEDSVCIKKGRYNGKTVILAAVCDGMGGLDKGGLASATVVKTLSRWYEEKLPEMVEGPDWECIKKSLSTVAEKLNSQIGAFGSEKNLRLGTTLCALVLIDDAYLMINVGDSRAYLMSCGTARQLTKDQTFVQREIDRGTLTLEEARRHPKRNMLLQCIGASRQVEPDLDFGTIRSGETYLLCTDGFRHHITNDELYGFFGGTEAEAEADLKMKIESVISLVMKRGEKDNITAVVLRAV